MRVKATLGHFRMMTFPDNYFLTGTQLKFPFLFP